MDYFKLLKFNAVDAFMTAAGSAKMETKSAELNKQKKTK